MNFRFLLVVELLLVLIGGVTMQAYGASCAQAERIRRVYWNDLNTGHPSAAADLRSQNRWAFGGTCGSWDMRGYGDYDRDHHWHDNDWWVGHDRGWVQQHHPNWVAEGEHHDNGHGEEHYEGEHHDYGHGEEHYQGEHHDNGHGEGHHQGQEHNHGHDHDNH